MNAVYGFHMALAGRPIFGVNVLGDELARSKDASGDRFTTGSDRLAEMSAFKVNVIVKNPKDEDMATPPVEALVDTGSELTWLPAELLRSAGITPRRKRVFATATQQKVEREVGFAIVTAEGYETIDEVVFAEPTDMALLGVRTLEGFGVAVDNIAHRFVATTTIVAVARRPIDG